MKILLVKPYNISDHVQPSLGLGYLATAVRKNHEVRILDCIKERMKIDRLKAFLKSYNPDVVGIQCYTFDIRFIDSALRLAKDICKDLITVVGGPHPTALPYETMSTFEDKLDFIFVGEAEIGLPRLLDALASGKRDYSDIPGLGWREGDSVRLNPRIAVDDLDSLGMPAWDLLKPQDYPEAPQGAYFKKFPLAPIMFTRGCPYKCSFCACWVVTGKKTRRRSIDQVLNEVLLLYNDFGIREFHVIDDNFTLDSAYVKEFLRRLKKLDLDISWAVPNGVRMDALDEEMLSLMKETGLYLVSLGIESGSDEVLRSMKKSLTIAKIRECVKRINDAGIDIAGFFILGFPGETRETIEETIRFSLELKLVRANFFTYLPFPGSESYRELESSGELKGVDWKRFYFMSAAYVPRGMTRRQLKSLHRLAFLKFYLRPRIIIYHIKTIMSFGHFIFVVRRVLNWLVVH